MDCQRNSSAHPSTIRTLVSAITRVAGHVCNGVFRPFDCFIINVQASLQQLQMTSHGVNLALGRWANTEHGRTVCGNLRSASVVDDLSADSQAQRSGLQRLQFFLALNLQGNLCLTVAFPSFQHWRILSQQRLVASERRMSALCSNFA